VCVFLPRITAEIKQLGQDVKDWKEKLTHDERHFVKVSNTLSIIIHPGFPLYILTNDSRVYSTITNQWLRARVKGGYAFFAHIVNFQGRSVTMRRSPLMCEAWHGYKSTPDLTVDHISSADKVDDSPENLRWATRIQQMSNRRKDCKPEEEKIRRGRRILRSDGQVYANRVDAAKSVNGDRSNIAVAMRKQTQSYGFGWSYADIIENLPGEVWAPFTDKGHLHISTQGRIKQIVRPGVEVAVHSPQTNGRVISKIEGYYWVNWQKDSTSSGLHLSMSVHELVLSTFSRCRREKEQGDHRNGDKLDNSLENLEWVSASVNVERVWLLRRGIMLEPTTTLMTYLN